MRVTRHLDVQPLLSILNTAFAARAGVASGHHELVNLLVQVECLDHLRAEVRVSHLMPGWSAMEAGVCSMRLTERCSAEQWQRTSQIFEHGSSQSV